MMIIPAVVTALVLGIAFDVLSLNSKSYYIFDTDAIANSLVTIHNPSTISRYRVIQTSSETNDFLSVGGELTLKAKHGWEGTLQGVGHYLAHPVNRKNTIELLCTVHHETVVETFPSYTKQREEWKSRRQEQVGTHYIRSIVYGGQLVVSYKMIVDLEEDMEEIKAAVNGAIAKEGSFDAHVAGNLQMMNNKLGSKYRVEITAYATTGVFNPPSTLESVWTLIREYPEMVKKVNDGKGAPVRVELAPLSSLDSKFSAYTRLGGMESIYNEAIDKLDDMMVADIEFSAWDLKLWNDEQQEQIDSYYNRLRNALDSMRYAITSLDDSEDKVRDNFEKAFKDYGEGPENLPNRYTREFSNLTHHVESIPLYWFPLTTASTHYIHWGSINCSLPSPVPVYVGYAATSPKGFGNGGNVLCLDIEPDFESSKRYDRPPLSGLTGLTYETPSGTTGFAYCAFCRLENATAVEVVAGRTTCPSDMKLEYTGYLATNKKSNSAFVCMAEQPDDKIVEMHAQRDELAGTLVPVWVNCEECEGDDDAEKARFLSCVVCSR